MVRGSHNNKEAEFVLKGNSNERMDHFETACQDIKDIGPKYEIVGQHHHQKSIPEKFEQHCVKVFGRTSK